MLIEIESSELGSQKVLRDREAERRACHKWETCSMHAGGSKHQRNQEIVLGI